MTKYDWSPVVVVTCVLGLLGCGIVEIHLAKKPELETRWASELSPGADKCAALPLEGEDLYTKGVWERVTGSIFIVRPIKGTLKGKLVRCLDHNK